MQGLLNRDPAFEALWRIESLPTPNVLVPLLIGLLANFVSVEQAGNVLLSLYFVGFPAGLILLGKQAAPDRISGSLIASLWVFNIFLYQGLIGYLISLTLAWFGMALVESWYQRPGAPKAAGLALLSLLCYFSHLMGYLILVTVLLCCSVLARVKRQPAVPAMILVGSQIVPLMLLLLYGLSRVRDTSVGFTLYDSLPNKGFSLVQPLFILVRFSPVYEFPLTTVLNILLLLTIAVLLYFGRANLAPSYRSLAGLMLVTVGALMPFSWFGGMLSPDGRLIFPGFLLLLSALSLRLDPGRARAMIAAVFIAISMLTVGQFAITHSGMAAIDRATRDILSVDGRLTVVGVMRYPIRNQCEPSWGNVGSVGVFPVLRVPFYAAIDSNKAFTVPLFRTGLVRRRDANTTIQRLTIELTTVVDPEESAVTSSLQDLQETPSPLIVLGCPADLDTIDGLIGTGMNRPTPGYSVPFMRVYLPTGELDR